MMAEAERAWQYGSADDCFIDEIHRFNKAQQDAFLPYVEEGTISLIGATTENPSFEVISALLSRSRVYVLKPLSDEQIGELVERALAEDGARAGRMYHAMLADDVLRLFAAYCQRRCAHGLNALEVAAAGQAASAGRPAARSRSTIFAMRSRAAPLRYDKDGEEHYDLISALHKSVRDSDPDAALYWLGRMLDARRGSRCISRGGWCAWPSRISAWPIPTALPQTLAAQRGGAFSGPCPRATWRWRRRWCIWRRRQSRMRSTRPMARPWRMWTETRRSGAAASAQRADGLMKDLNYGKGYKYAHDFEDKVADMQCLPDNLTDRVYYRPTSAGVEKRIGERLEEIKRRRSQKAVSPPRKTESGA